MVPPPGAKQKIDEKMFRLGGKFGPGLSLIPMYLYVIFGLRALLSISNKIWNRDVEVYWKIAAL